MTSRLALVLAAAAFSACAEEPTPASHPAAQARLAAAAQPVAATSASASAATSAAASGSCLVEAAEASEILGVAVTMSGPSAGSCSFTSEPLSFSGQVGVVPNYTVAAMVTNIAGASATAEPIAGLGERAAWASTSTWEGRDLSGLVGVEQGGQGVTVVLVARADVAEPDVRRKAEALARAALGSL